MSRKSLIYGGSLACCIFKACQELQLATTREAPALPGMRTSWFCDSECVLDLAHTTPCLPPCQYSTIASNIETEFALTTEPKNLTEIHAQSGLETAYTMRYTKSGFLIT